MTKRAKRLKEHADLFTTSDFTNGLAKVTAMAAELRQGNAARVYVDWAIDRKVSRGLREMGLADTQCEGQDFVRGTIRTKANEYIAAKWDLKMAAAVEELVREALMAASAQILGRTLSRSEVLAWSKKLRVSYANQLTEFRGRGETTKANLFRLAEHYAEVYPQWRHVKRDPTANPAAHIGLPPSILAHRFNKWPVGTSPELVDKARAKTLTEPYACALEHAAQLCGAEPFSYRTDWLSRVLKRQRAAQCSTKQNSVP